MKFDFTVLKVMEYYQEFGKCVTAGSVEMRECTKVYVKLLEENAELNDRIKLMNKALKNDELEKEEKNILKQQLSDVEIKLIENNEMLKYVDAVYLQQQTRFLIENMIYFVDDENGYNKELKVNKIEFINFLCENYRKGLIATHTPKTKQSEGDTGK